MMRVTIDEFMVADLPEGKSELVRGEVRLTPPLGGHRARQLTTRSRNRLHLRQRMLEQPSGRE
jgi:hypothetical protein